LESYRASGSGTSTSTGSSIFGSPGAAASAASIAVIIPVFNAVSSSSRRTGAAVTDQFGGNQGAFQFGKSSAAAGRIPLGGSIGQISASVLNAIPCAMVWPNCSES
jgi:hypothetical protein